MTRIKHLLSNAKLVSAGIAAVSIFALAAAFTAQYGFGLKPCDLCLAQRVPYALTILLGLAGLALADKSPKRAALFAFLSSIVFLAGAVIAFYHVGVEQHWWQSFLEGCKADFGKAKTPDELLKQIMATPAVPCDKPAWKDPLLHQSMAAWNVAASALLAVGSFLSSILISRKANGF